MTFPQSAPPYFDDYDPTKNYQAVLYKPGFAVQTRELNQTQSILQNQIQSFGDSIYTSGSVVSGGKTYVNNQVYSVKLLPVYSGAINVAPLVNLYAQGQTSGVIGQVMLAVSATATNPNTLVYQIRNAGTNSGRFMDNELINIFTDQACTVSYGVTVQVATGTVTNTTCTGSMNNNYLTVVSSTGINVGDRVIANTIGGFTYVTSIVGNIVNINAPLNYNIPATTPVTFSTDNSQPSTLVSISAGVYYVDGYFLNVNPQTIALDLYDRNSSYIVGLSYNPTIITSNSDSTLLDNANGSYNFVAPGADRLQIPLVLTKLPLTNNSPTNLTTSNFFELLRISGGSLLKQTDYPIYSELNQTMARRTYDEAGNFVVKNFKLSLTNSTQTSSAIKAKLSPGKAYVKGNAVSTIANTNLMINRALDTQSISSFDVSSFYGSYVIVSAPTGSLPQVGSGIQVELHNVITGFSAGTKIGTANIRYLQYASGAGASVVYYAYLFNIAFTGSYTIGTAKSLITTATAGVYSSITMEMNINAAGIVGGVTQLYNNTYKTALFNIPQTFISTVPLAEYVTRRVYKGVSFSSGVATINGLNGNEQFLGGSGVIPSAQAVAYFTVVATSTSSTYTAGQFVPLDLSSRSVTIPVVSGGTAGQATINLNDSGFNGTCDIEATLQLANDPRRLKTLVSAFNMNVTTPTSTISLAKSDVLDIVAIYDSGNPSIAATTASTNVTYKYTFDNGQRDTHYDFGNITLNAGQSAPTGQLLIVFDYFTHSGGLGYLTVDSYPIPYGTIPTYTDSTGVIHQLRDCLDFRPRRIDGSATLLFQSFQMPEPTFIMINESYYLSRIDKIVMSSSGQFQVVSGIPAYTNPQPPADLPDAMTLYTIVLPPYTIDASNCTIIASNNRRYTMNDIAALDSRLTTVEAYTALNMLEQAVTSTTLTNPSGATLYQNGFLVDPFVDFTVADGGNADFSCSIDTTNNCARAPFSLNSLAMQWYPTGSTSVVTGNLVTAPYTSKAYISQTMATKYLNINPFNVFSNVGVLTLSPNTDTWYDTQQLPLINATNPAAGSSFSTAQLGALGRGQSATFGEWNNFMTPPQGSTSSFDLANGGTETDVTSYSYVYSNKVLSTSTEPYMRPKVISFNVTGLTPFANIYTWLDGTNISNYVTSSGATIQPQGVTSYNTVSGGSGYTSASVFTVNITGGGGSGATANVIVNHNGSISLVAATFGSGYTSMPNVVVSATGGGSGASFTASNSNIQGMPIVTDRHGNASGTISIPNDGLNKFLCGTHNIIMSNNTDSPITASSYAAAPYTAQGYLSIDQTTVSTQESNRVYVTPPPQPVDVPAPTTSTNTTTGTATTTTVTPTIPAYVNSTLTVAQAAAAMAASTGYTVAQCQTALTNVSAGYAASPVLDANTARSVVASDGTVLASGIPDVQGAVWWATQALQNNMTAGQVATQIANGAVTNTAQESANIVPGAVKSSAIDPLAQTIIVDGTRNPNGIFVQSVDLFFASNDNINPCYVEIRTMDNGYPTTTIIPYSQVTVMPSSITTSTNGTVATNVAFQCPIYLAPGQYALTIKSDSNNFNMFVGQVGQVMLNADATVTSQPYVGSLFESQNASTWIAEGGINLCFVLYQCNFAVGTTNFYLSGVAAPSTTTYDIIHLTSQKLNYSGVTKLSVQLAATPLGGTLGSYNSFTENVDYNFSTRQQIVSNGDIMANYTISTTNSDVSPVLDLSRSSAVLIQNVINQSSAWTLPETTPYGGSAAAKYVSQKVVLAPGMNSDNLIVYLNVNRPASTSIQVYYKVQNQFDTTNFLNLPWVLMNQELNGGYTSQAGAIVEDKWSSYAISYTNGGTTYNNFNAYAIKVVFQSSNPSYSPSIYDLREIATA